MIILNKEEKIHEWKALYTQYRSILKSNRKSVSEILAILKKKYPVEEDHSVHAKKVVEANILKNYYARRLPAGEKTLAITVFRVKNEGSALGLYKNQTAPFVGVPIMIGIEAKSGFIYVEGSPELAEEITIIQGLDADELTNYYLVANYIQCLKKSEKNESVLNK